MKYKIGDFVRFVDEPIEGNITSFRDNDIVGVTDDSGFEIPVPVNKITLVHGNMRHEDDDFSPVKAAAEINTPFVKQGIYLGVVGKQNDGLAKFYLINHTSYDVLITVSEINGAKRTGLFAEKIFAKDFAEFYAANFSNIGKWPNFEVQILRHTKQSSEAVPMLCKELRIKPMDINQPKVNDDLLEEKVWRFELDKLEEDLGLDKLKERFISHRPNRR